MPRIIAGQCTRQGKKSETNGDAVLILNRQAKVGDKGATLAAVMDGMGGESISEMACTTISELFTDLFRTRNLAEPGSILAEAIKAANQRIHSERNSQRSLRGMGASVAAVILTGNDLHIAHVGDCRVYLQRGSSLYRLTRDHSWREDGEPGGSDGVASHLMDKAVTRSLGYRNEVEIELSVHRLRAGDQIFLCTDGVSDHLTDRDIMVCLGEASAAKACRTMIEASLSRGDDDASAVVLHFGTPAWRMKKLAIAAMILVLSLSMLSVAVKKILRRKSARPEIATATGKVNPNGPLGPVAGIVTKGGMGRSSGAVTGKGAVPISGKGGASTGVATSHESLSTQGDGAAATGQAGSLKGQTGENKSDSPGNNQGEIATGGFTKFDIPDFLTSISTGTTPSAALASLVNSPGNDIFTACEAVRAIVDPRSADAAFLALSRLADNFVSDSVDSATLPSPSSEIVRKWTTDSDNPSRYVALCASRRATHFLEILPDSANGITVEAEALPGMVRNPFIGLRPVRLTPSSPRPGEMKFEFDAAPGDRVLFRISSTLAEGKSGFRLTATASPATIYNQLKGR